MGHEPVLIPDYTLLIQLGIYFASYFVLRIFVFNPYLTLLRLRREKTIGMKEEALKAKEQAEKLRVDYENFMKAERKRIGAWADQERKQIQDEEHRVIAVARTAASEELQHLRGQTQVAAEKARQQLLPLINEYSSQLVSKLIGRKISVSGISVSGSAGETEERLPTP